MIIFSAKTLAFCVLLEYFIENEADSSVSIEYDKNEDVPKEILGRFLSCRRLVPCMTSGIREDIPIWTKEKN